MLHVNHFSCTLHSPYTLISTKYVIHVIVKERTAIRTRLIVSHFCVSFYTGQTLNFLGEGERASREPHLVKRINTRNVSFNDDQHEFYSARGAHGDCQAGGNFYVFKSVEQGSRVFFSKNCELRIESSVLRSYYRCSITISCFQCTHKVIFLRLGAARNSNSNFTIRTTQRCTIQACWRNRLQLRRNQTAARSHPLQLCLRGQFLVRPEWPIDFAASVIVTVKHICLEIKINLYQER